TVLEAEAEQVLPEEIVEGEDEGPLVATGPDRYVREEAEGAVDAAVPSEAAQSEPEEQPLAIPEAETPPAPQPRPAAAAKKAPEAAPAAEEVAAPGLPFEGPGEWYVVHTYAGY